MDHTADSAPISGWAEVNGTRLYYEIAGRGDPVVLIHGFTLDTRMWNDQVPALAREFLVIRYDMRGFGRSAVPDGATYAHHDDLRALLDHLGTGPAHVVGLSLGGAVALDFAVVHPAYVRSLVLADVSGLRGYPWPDVLRDAFASFNAAARAGDMTLAKQRWLDTDWFAPARAVPEVRARLEEMVAEYSGWHFANPNPVQGMTPPTNERLSEIRAPTLVLVGERDLDYYNRPLAHRLAGEIPGARLIELPGAGHMSNMETPARFTAEVVSFTRSTPTTSRV